MFDELSDAELDAARAAVSEKPLETARLFAAARLLAGPAAGVDIDPTSLVDLLMSRDTDDPRWELVSAFELRWALLVLRLVDRVLRDPAAAVADARRRGATWPSIADVMGVSPQAVSSRFRTVTAGRSQPGS